MKGIKYLLLQMLPAVLAMAVIQQPLELRAECQAGQFKDQRRRMVTQQIVARGVSSPAVIEAMRSVPRH